MRVLRRPNPANPEAGFWVELIVYIALYIVGELIRPKPKLENARPAGLGDFNFPTATEGRVVPLVWGTVRIDGPNVVWWGDFEQQAIKKKIKTGLFTHTTQITGYRYFLGLQFALCRGAVDVLRRIWVNEKIVFDGTAVDQDSNIINQPDLFGGDDLGSGGLVGTVQFFAGARDQAVSSYLSGRALSAAEVHSGGSGWSVGDIVTVSGGTFTTPAKLRVAGEGSGIVTALQIIDAGSYTVFPTNPASTTGLGSGLTVDLTFGDALQSINGHTPAYVGTSYLLAEHMYVGNSTTIQPWSFEISRIPDGLGLGGIATVNLLDANPMNVVYEIMTDKDWGLGYDTSTIDSSSFSSAASTLYTEGNGFSMVLDNAIEAIDLLREVERQIDGVIFFNQSVGKWQVNLARGGYIVADLPAVDPSNFVELTNFSRGSWEDTTNQVRTEFNDRNDQYKQTYGFAQDLANVRIQNGVNISATSNLPGVKDRTLANSIAWRTLRTVSYPLARASVIVDRTLYELQPGQVVRFTDPDIGVTDLPMRVGRVDLGDLEDNRVGLDLIQDIFIFEAGAFSDPTNTEWSPPSDDLQPFESDLQLAFEAPRGFVVRDPQADGIVDKIWCGARRRGPEVSFKIVERHASGTPSGPFAEAGESFGFMVIGELQSSLSAGTAQPTSTVNVVASPDSQGALEVAINDSVTPSDLGVNLVNLVLINDELLLVTSAQDSGAVVQLNNVYRGVLDTVQASHPAGSLVYVLSAGGAMTDSTFTPNDFVDIKLLPRSLSDLLSESDATTIALQMLNRVRRPYAPSSVSLNGTLFASTTSLEGTGSGGETYGVLSLFNRRDYRTTDEVAALTTDAASIFADFPAANGTTVEVDVRNDPAGTNTLLYTFSGAGPTLTVLRLHVLRYTSGVLPSRLRLVIRAKHTDAGTLYASRQDLTWNFNVTSALSGQFAFGALAASVSSNLYTATQNGTYNFTLSTAFSSGNVEYSKNGGGFTTLIAASSTSGSIAGIVATDTIRVRHTSTDPGAEKFLTMAAPGGGQNAFAVLYV